MQAFHASENLIQYYAMLRVTRWIYNIALVRVSFALPSQHNQPSTKQCQTHPFSLRSFFRSPPAVISVEYTPYSPRVTFAITESMLSDFVIVVRSTEFTSF